MKIENIASNFTASIQNRGPQVKEKTFDTYFDNALQMWNETNGLEKKSDKAISDFVMGKTDDLSSVVLANQKANVALQFTVKVRDTLLDSYNEIMRMQV